MTWIQRSAASEPPGIRCRRVGLEDRPWALSLLLTGRASGGDLAVEAFEQHVRDQGLSLDRLWVATRNAPRNVPRNVPHDASDEGTADVASLVLLNPGRTAMTLVSPLLDEGDEPVAAALLRHVCEAEDVREAQMIQALLDPPQRRERRAFEAAGFSRLADLLYMQRQSDLPPLPLEVPQGLTVTTWSEAARPLFASAILASYEGTRDCPGLLGLRGIDDVLAGHMATGTFTPDLWRVVHRGDEPAGIILVNLLPQRAMSELVYLGLSPSYRGQGLARSLVLHALSEIPQRGISTMVLAVDDTNAPALRLYRRLGFSQGVKKTAMVRSAGAI